MSIQQKVKFNKLGLNQDDSIEEKSGFTALYNVRILSTDSEDGSLTTSNGNTLVPFTLPSGNNTSIGYCEDVLTKKGYAFIYNSLANHSIIQHDQVTNTIAFVLQNKPSFDNTSTPLNFQLAFLITSCYIVERDENNHLLYWTDNYHDSTGTIYNEPKKINIEKGLLYMSSGGTDKAGYFLDTNNTTFNPHWIDRIKEPPSAPTYVWSGLPIASNIRNIYATQAGHAADTISFPTGATQNVTFQNVITNLGTNASWSSPTATLNTTGLYSTYFVTEWILTATTAAWVDITLELWLNGSTVIATRTGRVISVSDIFSSGISFINAIFNAGDTLVLKISLTTSLGSDTCTVQATNLSNNKVDIYWQGATLTNTPNNLFKRLPRFQSAFGFDDKEKSVLSSMSGYVLPATALNPIYSTGEDYVLQDNTVTITVETGSEIVTDIYIYGQLLNANNLDTITATSLIVRLNKKDLGIRDNTTYDYTFLNDGNYTPLDLKSATSLFDNIFYWEQASEFFIDRIADANGADNCDATPSDMRFVLDFTQQVETNANSFFPAKSYLKSGANYDFPLVYGLNGKKMDG